MDRNALRQFANRDWSALAASKTRHWRTPLEDRPTRRLTCWPSPTGCVSTRSSVRPEWPTPQQRLEDVRVHQRVGEALRAVARAASR